MTTALVTGAASGMGRACVRRFVAAGWDVAALDVDGPGLRALAAGTGVGTGASATAGSGASATAGSGARTGGAVLPLEVDVRDPAGVHAAVAEAGKRLGAPTACVNAAGVFPPSTLTTADVTLYRRVFDTNLLGTVLVCQAVAAAMRAAGGGAIVNFASVDGLAPSAGQLLYCASKAAVVMLTRSLALELAPAVRVNAVAPGWIDTEGNRATGRMDGAAASVPLGRVGTSEEVADLVWFLVAGEGAGYVTGETLVASGGSLTR